MGRIGFRNSQSFYYALYDNTEIEYDTNNYEAGAYANYKNPVLATGNISPARGNVLVQQFGDDVRYDKVIIVSDRDTPIDEHTVMWIDTPPTLDANGATATPYDYVVRRVARGLPAFGSTVIAVSKVNVS